MVYKIEGEGSEMSGLKEKAFNISTQPDKPLYVVRLEDVEQALDNLRWNLQRTIISLQKELKELKEGKQSG
jgi:hypothetical protein